MGPTAQGVLRQHGNTETLFHHIQAAADTNSVPTYENAEAMISTLQHLHMSDLLHHDEDVIDPHGPNDIDVSRMVPNGTANNDYTTGGNPEFQKQIRQLLQEYDDIFSYNVKGKAMSVPPMTFTVAKMIGKHQKTGYPHATYQLTNMWHLTR